MKSTGGTSNLIQRRYQTIFHCIESLTRYVPSTQSPEPEAADARLLGIIEESGGHI